MEEAGGDKEGAEQEDSENAAPEEVSVEEEVMESTFECEEDDAKEDSSMPIEFMTTALMALASLKVLLARSFPSNARAKPRLYGHVMMPSRLQAFLNEVAHRPSFVAAFVRLR